MGPIQHSGVLYTQVIVETHIGGGRCGETRGETASPWPRAGPRTHPFIRIKAASTVTLAFWPPEL